MRFFVRAFVAVAVFSACSLPAAAADLPGQPCEAAGITRMSEDESSIIACLQTSLAANPIWKPMTPVYGLPNGNVGIGTHNPRDALEVARDKTHYIVVSAGPGFPHASTGLQMINGGGTYASSIQSYFGDFRLYVGNNGSAPNGNHMALYAGNTGNIGIGIPVPQTEGKLPTPRAMLDVRHNNDTILIKARDSTSFYGGLVAESSDDDRLGGIRFHDPRANGWYTAPKKAMEIWADGPYGGTYGNTGGGDVVVSCGSGCGSHDNNLLIYDGKIGIGTNNPNYALHVVGTAYADGAAGALSDARHKDNIKDLSLSGLETVGKLRPVSFTWKEPKDKGMMGAQIGFVAQEVEKFLPQIVLTSDDAEKSKGLKYDALIPVLTKAIQELKTENDALLNHIKVLDKRVEQLEGGKKDKP